MYTIFISILSGVEAKNILRTNILDLLLQHENIKVVLFVKSKDRIKFYQKEFQHPCLSYETISHYDFSFLNKYVEALKHHLVRTTTLSLYKRLVFEDTRNYFVFAASHLLSFMLGRKPVRKIVRVLDRYIVRDSIFAAYFEKYRPDIVFLANLFDEAEISFLREAKRRGVASVGFINSWDKITAKGFVRLLPDKLIVTNEIVKKEAMQFVDMKKENIFVSGVPQYDIYFDKKDIVSREEFFERIHADPARCLVVYAPMGTSLSNSDWLTIDMMRDIIDNEINSGAELLVRFQPNDFFDATDEFKKRSWLRYDLPGTRFGSTRGVDWDMSNEELLHLKNTLYHVDVLVSYATSLSIDVACFDKPVININFEILPDQPALKTPTRRYATHHYQNVLKTGGIRLVENREKLVQWVNTYIRDPHLDSAGRKQLVHEQCYKLDGKSGERIANFVVTLLNNSHGT